MKRIEITRFEDVRGGDFVALEHQNGVKVSGKAGTHHDYGELTCLHIHPLGEIPIRDGWRFVSATREVSEWEPGTVGTATVRGVEGVRVMRTSGTGGADVIWLSASMVSGVRGHEGCHVTDFLPDDAEVLRRLLEVALAGHRREAADWRARDRRMGAEVDRLEAEVERLRAARTLPTWAQVQDALGQVIPYYSYARVLALIEQGGAA